MNTIYVCEDSLEGVFTGIYTAWESKKGHDHCEIQVGPEGNLRLFTEYMPVAPDQEKAEKVGRTIHRRLGAEAYRDVCSALASQDPLKGEAVYKMLVAGFALKNQKSVMTNLQNPHVYKVFELSRRVGREVHRMLEFLRFQELRSGVLFARIAPQNDILDQIAPHFADRLPLENFMIYDENRRKMVIHKKQSPWFLVSGETLDEEAAGDYSDQEELMQELFRHFCDRIAIDSRRNENLQRQMLPLYFRDYMVEFCKNQKSL